MVDLLSRLPAADFQKLCHRVVDGLCGREPPHRSDYSTTWTPEEWLELQNSLTALFRLAVGNDSCDEEVLTGLSGVGSSHTEVVLSVLRARQDEIRQALLHRTNAISSTTLQDFDWQLKVGDEILPQVEEFKYLGVLFTSEGRMETEVCGRIGAAAAVIRTLHRSVVVKKELSRKAKLLIYRSIYVPTLTYGHELQLALSSDKISSLQTPLLNLSLDVRENGALRTVNVEMNREELNMLISSLEAANKVVLQMK